MRSAWEFCWLCDPRRRTQWHDLLLRSRLIAIWFFLEPFHRARLVRSIDAALNSARERFDAILHRTAQQRLRIELDVFVGLALEHKEPTKSVLDVIKSEA